MGLVLGALLVLGLHSCQQRCLDCSIGWRTYHGLDKGSLLQDLLEDLVLVGGTELVLELTLACLVELALGTVATGGEDVVGLKNLRQRRGRILLELLVVLWLRDENNEVLLSLLLEKSANIHCVATG